MASWAAVVLEPKRYQIMPPRRPRCRLTRERPWPEPPSSGSDSSQELPSPRKRQPAAGYQRTLHHLRLAATRSPAARVERGGGDTRSLKLRSWRARSNPERYRAPGWCRYRAPATGTSRTAASMIVRNPNLSLDDRPAPAHQFGRSHLTGSAQGSLPSPYVNVELPVRIRRCGYPGKAATFQHRGR